MSALILILVLQASESMDELLRLFMDNDPEIRDEAVLRVERRWKEWTDADVDKLRRARDDRDPDVASRARNAYLRVKLRGGAGPALAPHLSEIEVVLKGHDEEAQVQLLIKMARLWQKGEVSKDALRGLADLVPAPQDDAAKNSLVLFLDRSSPKTDYAPFLGHMLGDPNPSVRATATRILGTWKEASYAPRMAKLLRDPDAEVRAVAADAIASTRAEGLAPDVARLLNDPDPRVRNSAVDALARLNAFDFFEDALPFFRQNEGNLSPVWRQHIGHTGARRLAPKVADLLSSDSEPVRSAAAEVLGRMGAHEYVFRLLEFLKRETQPLPRRSALHGLGLMGAGGCDSTVAGYLEDPDLWVRAEAVRALGRMGSRGSLGKIITLLQSEYTPIRANAAESAAELAGEDEIGPIGKLLKDSRPETRATAIHVLGRLEAKAYAIPIARYLSDLSPDVQSEACVALAALGGVPSAAALLQALEDVNGPSEEASLALGTIGPRLPDPGLRARIADALRAKRQAGSPRVVRAAAVALLRLGEMDRSAEVALVDAVRGESGVMAEALLEALSFRHDRATAEKLERSFVPEAVLESPASLIRRLEDEGLRLVPGEPLRPPGRTISPRRTSLRRLLREAAESRVIVTRGETISMTELHTGLADWAARLK